MKVYNATRHWQNRQQIVWDRLGIQFVPGAGPGINSIPDSADVEQLMLEVDETMNKVKTSGADAVLVGGISGLAILIGLRAVLDGFDVIEPAISGKSNGQPIIVGVRNLTHAICHVAGIEDGS